MSILIGPFQGCENFHKPCENNCFQLRFTINERIFPLKTELTFLVKDINLSEGKYRLCEPVGTCEQSFGTAD